METSERTPLETILSLGTIVALVLVGISGREAAYDTANVYDAVHSSRTMSFSETPSQEPQNPLYDYAASLSPEDKAEVLRASAIMLGTLVSR